MMLCHKCAGVLAANDNEDISGLSCCQCISGWVRGFEKHLTRAQAIAAQIEAAQDLHTLYMRQNRSLLELVRVQERLDSLRKLIA